jgi:GT2 family glycosyltransferase
MKTPETSSGWVHGMVSTIIPVYNRPRQLGEAVASVLAQDYRPIEVLIVDDGSTDGETWQVAQALADLHPGVVFSVRQANTGPGLARECGRRLARGEFIQYLDSDDVLLPGKFTFQVAALRADPDAAAAYGITFLREADGTLHQTPHKDSGVRHERMFPRFLNERWWNTSTPLYRASVCTQAGPWTDLSLEEDWEYDCRIAALGGKLAYVPMPVSEHRGHAGARLSVGERLDPKRLSMRARAQTLIWGHAKRAGLPETAKEEVAIFARSLFLLSRQCGAAGLSDESARLLELSAEAARAVGARMPDLDCYRQLAHWLGYRALGMASEWVDKARGALRVRG